MERESRQEDSNKLVASNREAGHLYHLYERFEAGLALVGTEVKAAREGRVNLRDSFVTVRNEEAFLQNCDIGPYSHQGYASHEARRQRKLLLHKAEIRKLQGKLTLRGYTLVPTRMYLKKGRLKLEVALAEGKKTHDKREALRKKDAEREIRKQMKER